MADTLALMRKGLWPAASARLLPTIREPRRGGGNRPAPDAQKVGWRVREWAAAVGCCRAQVYLMLNRGELDSVKVGRMRIITTSPDQFLTKAAQQSTP
jgi:hypothetical protein